jgi:Domain of unknown function (DUF4410)
MPAYKFKNAGDVRTSITPIVRRVLASAIFPGLALAVMTACARVSTEDVMMRGPGLPKPERIIVHDYQVSPSGVQLDSGVGSRLERLVKGTPEEQEQLKLEQPVARIGTKTLVEEIRKLGLRAEPAAAASPVEGPTLSIEGQILSINEGNKTRRLIIGFGAGASEVRTLTQVYETTGGEYRLVDDFYTTAKSSRKPGVGPMGGSRRQRGCGGGDRSRERTLPDGGGRHSARGPRDREGSREVLCRAALDHPGSSRQAFLGPLALVPDTA